MENTETNYDDVIAKAVTDPEGTMQSLDNAKNMLQQLSDKTKEVKATAGVQDTNSGVQTEDDSASQWSFEDTIDELMSKFSGYTYYDLPWSKRNTPKSGGNRYNIDDESGTVKANASEDDVIEYANTVYHYDMADNEAEEFKTFDDAKNALENEGHFNVVNVTDTKQISLFPTEKNKEVEEPTNTVISKMDDATYQDFLNKFRNPYTKVQISQTVDLLRANKQKDAYSKLRKLLDSLRENKENLVNSETFRIIAESEKPKLMKSDILEFVKQRKK
jgi:hypothetical protein